MTNPVRKKFSSSEIVLFVKISNQTIILVCEGVINKLRAQLPDNAQPEEIELEFKKWCKTAQGKEEKFVSIFF